ncbi:MAG: hypothetical protein E6G34_02370 [Actinobacteria bacterium]|nr:MAG: hypothetical protein E6G34_02370 [Actinomycetota bacterium]
MKTSLIDFAGRPHLAPFALRRRRAARGGFATALQARAGVQPHTEPGSHGHPARPPRATPPAGRELSEAAPPCDLAVQRARAAGGPMDRASYACECGYLFLAAVSTTVACPHCQATQAW